jgi:hypothetical protein
MVTKQLAAFDGKFAIVHKPDDNHPVREEGPDHFNTRPSKLLFE